MTDDIYNKLIDIIKKQICLLFSKWRNKQIKKNNSEKQQMDILIKTQKTIANNISQKDIYVKSHKQLYKEIKIRLVAYEFN